MKDVEHTLHDLTDRLGDDHDLADLRRVLTDSDRPARKTVDPLLERIAKRRAKLQADARSLGARIYGEKPKIFSRRLEGYWDAWRS